MDLIWLTSFKESKCKIFGLIRWRSPLENLEFLIPSVNQEKRVKLLYGDLNDEAFLNAVMEEVRPDYIFHLAIRAYKQVLANQLILHYKYPEQQGC